MENPKDQQDPVAQEETKQEEKDKGKKKVSLSEFKVKSFVTHVKVDQMQFLKTAGG
jgi:hypothetical protein